MGDAVTLAAYLVVGVGLAVSLLVSTTQREGRERLGSGWYTLTGSRDVGRARVVVMLVALFMWPALAAVWISDSLGERKTGA